MAIWLYSEASGCGLCVAPALSGQQVSGTLGCCREFAPFIRRKRTRATQAPLRSSGISAPAHLVTSESQINNQQCPGKSLSRGTLGTHLY